MANPKAWLPFFGETKGRRAAFVGAGLVASLAFHLAIPYSGLIHRVQAVSEGPIEVSLLPPPPIPLPEDDQLKVATDDKDVDAPRIEDEPVQEAEEPELPPPSPEDTKEPDPAQTPPPPPDAAPPPVQAPPNPDAPAASPNPDETQEERDRRRRERLAERRRRFEERRRQRLANGGQKGGAPDSGDWRTGKPESVYACTATARGEELHVKKERGLNEWVTIVPTVLTGFRTRPDIGDYLEGTTQIVQRDKKGLKRLGFVEVALDDDVLQLDLDEPRGVRLAVGRLDGRCLVGFKYTVNLFPMTMLRAPVRIIDGSSSTSVLVDFVLYKDVSFEMRSVDGTVLPFSKGRLKNGKAITQNIEDHYQAARFAKAVADVLGISLTSGSSYTPRSKPVERPRTAQERRTAAAATNPLALPALAEGARKRKAND